LRGEMEDVRAIREQRREVGVLDARLDEPEAAARSRAAEIPLLHDARVVISEAVDADDVVAAIEEAFGERGSDESRGAGDQCFHVNSVRTRAGTRHGLPLRPSVA